MTHHHHVIEIHCLDAISADSDSNANFFADFVCFKDGNYPAPMSLILHFRAPIAAGVAAGTFVLVFEARSSAIAFLDLAVGC